ncbi:MAG: vWA domain-containing protein [Acidimicrobiales bacterium]
MTERRLAVARLWAVSRHPYLAAALFASPVIAVPGLGRVSVDEAWRLYVDPELVDSWSVEVLGSLLVHHAGHLIRDHAGRARDAGVDGHSAKDWGLASDAEINDDLMGAGLRLPGGAVLPQALGWAPGRLAEEYFHSDQRHDQLYEPDCGGGADAQPRTWEMLAAGESGGLPKGQRHLIRCQVASHVLSYTREGMGRLPASWRRWAEELLEPTVDWRRALAGEIRKGVGATAGLVDYSYRRPSRRAGCSPDVVLPALERPTPEVVVLCDTSGSMSNEQLARVLAEIDGLLRGIGLARTQIRVMSVDAAVHRVKRVSSSRQVELVGGGGTDMTEGLAAAARLRPRPSVVVVLTDGMTPWPAAAPKGFGVVVGLVGTPRPAGGQAGRSWEPPTWARVVYIDDATRSGRGVPAA